MPEDIDLKLIDKRVVARYLAKGRLDEKDYEKHVKSLPDLAERAVPIESDLDEEEEYEEEESVVAQAGQQEPTPQAATQVEPASQPPQGSEPQQPPAPPSSEPQGS